MRGKRAKEQVQTKNRTGTTRSHQIRRQAGRFTYIYYIYIYIHMHVHALFHMHKHLHMQKHIHILK